MQGTGEDVSRESDGRVRDILVVPPQPVPRNRALFHGNLRGGPTLTISTPFPRNSAGLKYCRGLYEEQKMMGFITYLNVALRGWWCPYPP